MKLDFLMLADGANVAEGKIYVHGGAITRATFPSFPSSPMMVTAVARFLVDVDEMGTPQEAEVVFEIAHEAEAGAPLGSGVLRWEPSEQIRTDEEQAVVLVAPILIVFDRPGRWELRLLLDGEPVGSRSLLAVQQDAAPADAKSSG